MKKRLSNKGDRLLSRFLDALDLLLKFTDEDLPDGIQTEHLYNVMLKYDHE